MGNEAGVIMKENISERIRKEVQEKTDEKVGKVKGLEYGRRFQFLKI